MINVSPIFQRIAGLICIAGFAACSSGQAGSVPPVATPNVATQSILQFAVGTATIGTANGASALGLNVVATFRQPNGNNATGVNTPTLTGPAGLNFGPLLGNSNHISGETPAQLGALAAQIRAAGKKASTIALPASLGNGFGPFVGVFGYGLAADNLVSNADIASIATTQPVNTQPCEGIGTNYIGTGAGVNPGNGGGTGSFFGSPPAVNGSGFAIAAGQTLGVADLVRSAELALPVTSGASIFGPAFCTCPSTCVPSGAFSDPAFPVQYFGGPPAWPSPQGYGNYSYFVGYPLGFTDFTATPLSGSYSLSVSVPTSADYSTSSTLTQTAHLAIGAPLPAFPQPVLQINPDGSGTLSVNVPTGLREAVVTIVTADCDLTGRTLGGKSFVDHYALVTHAPGPQTLFLSPSLGPPVC